MGISQLLTPATVSAAVGINRQINFQGKLVNLNGTNVTDGTYSVVFSIYTVSTAGTAIWTETQTVGVTTGIFQVDLGSVTALPGSVDFNSDNIYLGIKVGADAEMTPRVRFTAVPQAFNSEKLGGLDKTGFVQNGTSQQAATNFNISGTGVVGTSLTSPLIQNAGTLTLAATGANSLLLQTNGATRLTVDSAGGASFGGTLSVAGVITSTVATGTAPLTVASTTKVTNLNVDLLDGLDSTAFAAATGSANYIQNGSAAQTANFNVTGTGAIAGDFTNGNNVTRSFTRALSATVNNEVDLGSFSFTNGGGNLLISVTVPSAGFSQSKQYIVPIGYDGTANTWRVVQPTNDSGPYSGNDFAMDINVSLNVANLRLRKTAGANAGTAYVTIVQQGVVTDAFTASSASAAVAAPTLFYAPTVISQTGGTATIQGNVVISNSGNLTVAGQINSTIATGTAPLTVASTTKVTNLNADLLDGLDSTAFAAATGSANYIQNGTTAQAGANFNITGNGTLANLIVNGVINGQSAALAGDVLNIGNDSKIVDINIANTTGLYGLQDTTVGGIKFGSAGPTLYGATANLGINNTNPTARLHVTGVGLFNAAGGTTPVANAGLEVDVSAQSVVTIGESAAGNANPAITLYRTSAGLRTGTASRIFNPNSNGTLELQSGTANTAYGSETYVTNLTVTAAGVANARTGYQINGTAAAGQFLRGDGTNFVSSALQASDLPAGSGNYIQNGTTAQAGANFNIAGSGTLGSAIINGGGQALSFVGPGSNFINFGTSGVGPPTTTTRSLGTKIVLYPQVNATEVDYALGIDGSTLYSSVPANTSTYNFKWYGGTALIGSLSGTGNMTLAGTLTAQSTSNSVFGNGTAGGIQIGDALITKNSGIPLQLNTGALFTSSVSISNSIVSSVATNVNISATPSIVNGLNSSLIGSTNPNVNANTLIGLNLPNVSPIANNSFYGINVGTGFNDILRYNGTQLISGSGLLQSAAVSGAYGNLTGTGVLASGSIASGFGTITTTNTITGSSINGTTGINSGAGAGTQRIDSSGNLLNVGNITGSGNLVLTGRTTQLSNLYPEYRLRYGGGIDFNWKKIADVTIAGSNIYAGASFQIDITDAASNYGASSDVVPLRYYVSAVRSTGVQDVPDNGTVSGPISDYVRLVKTALGVYEIQVRQTASYRHLDVVARQLSDSGSLTVNYITNPVDGSTTGAIYNASTTGYTQNLANANINGNLLVGGTTVITAGRALQNVTADAGILTTGTLASARLSGGYTGITAVGTLTGLTSSGVITSTVATGTAPLSIASTTQVPNLNVSMLGGFSENQIAQNLRSNNNISGGGTVTWNGSLNWTNRFIVITNGNGADFSSNGYFDINVPAAGTVITGVGGSGNITTTASGVPLGAWQALYYILPIGGGNSSLNANFRVASYTSGLTVPSNWLLIGLNNGDNGTLRIATGFTLRSGQTVTNGTIDNPTFNGSVNTSTGYQIGGTAATGNFLRGNGTNFVSSAIQVADIPAGSGSYIQNGTAQQASSNFNISGNGTIGGTLLVSSTSNSQFGNGVTGGLQIGDGIITKTGGAIFQLNTGVNIGSGGLEIGGIGVITAARVLQNVTTDTSILTSGTLGVARGGTGAGTFTANGILFGNTTGAIQATAAGVTGQCLIGNTGAAPSFGTCGAGVTTVATFSASSQPNGASIASNTITFGPADATNPGMVSTGTQTFAGAKTFLGATSVSNTADSAAAFKVVRQATATNVLTVDTTNSQAILRGINSSATEGGNTFGGFATTAGWAIGGSGSTSTAAHTSGGGTTAISASPAISVAVDTVYKVTYTVSGRTTGSVYYGIGGIFGFIRSTNATFTEYYVASTTANLTFLPTNDFNGTVSAVSVQAVSMSNAVLQMQNSTGVPQVEIRASNISTNQFFGLKAGRNNTTGIENTALGTQALEANTTGNLNTATGAFSLQVNTTGSNNTAFGGYALFRNTNGGDNTAIGAAALQDNTTGLSNTALGSFALLRNTTGTGNNGVGASALQTNTTGSNNTANGSFALFNNTTGSNNIAIGRSSLYFNTTGGNNTATGSSALGNNSSGAQNTANGYFALLGNTTGNNNTATGSNALENNTSGLQNTANGALALQGNTTGNNNTATSYSALQSNTTGFLNSAYGTFALASNTTGSYNVAFGSQAGSTSVGANANTTGSNNTFIGYNSGPGVVSASSLQNATAIGNLAVVNTSNSLVLGSINGVNGATSNVNVGIGTAAPGYQLHVKGAGQTTSALSDLGVTGGMLLLQDSLGNVGSGGALLFGGSVGRFASIKGLLIDNNFQSQGDLAFSTRNLTTDTTLTERLVVRANGNIGIGINNATARLHVVGLLNNNVAPASVIPSLILDNAATSSQNVAELRVAGVRRASLRFDQAGNVVLSGSGASAVYLGYDEGTGGVNFGNGAGGVVASVNSAGTGYFSNRVGIGIGAPNAKLDVRGDALGTTTGSISEISRQGSTASNDVYLRTMLQRTVDGTDWTTASLGIQRVTDTTAQASLWFNGSSSVCINLTNCTTNGLGVNGNVIATGGIGGGGTPDIAETIQAAPDVEAADVVMADPLNTERVVKSDKAYSGAAVGVIADGTSTFTIAAYGKGTDTPGYKPLVLAGRVPVKVTDEGGFIRPGDPLTSSSTPGYAMKAIKAGPIIGKALGSFNGTTGTVLVMVNSSYHNPNDGNNLQAKTVSAESLFASGDIIAGGSVNVGANLNVSGISTVTDLVVKGSVTIAKNLTVQGLTSVQDLSVAGHIITAGSAPNVAAMPAAGTGATVVIDGNDTSGTITVTTGAMTTTTNAAGQTVTTGSDPTIGDIGAVEFTKQFGRKVQVSLTPANAPAADMRYFVQGETTKFTLSSTSLPAQNQTYIFTYLVRE